MIYKGLSVVFYLILSRVLSSLIYYQWWGYDGENIRMPPSIEWSYFRLLKDCPLQLMQSNTKKPPSRNSQHTNHIFPIQTKSNDYQTVQICNHMYIPFLFEWFQYYSI